MGISAVNIPPTVASPPAGASGQATGDPVGSDFAALLQNQVGMAAIPGLAAAVCPAFPPDAVAKTEDPLADAESLSQGGETGLDPTALAALGIAAPPIPAPSPTVRGEASTSELDVPVGSGGNGLPNHSASLSSGPAKRSASGETLMESAAGPGTAKSRPDSSTLLPTTAEAAGEPAKLAALLPESAKTFSSSAGSNPASSEASPSFATTLGIHLPAAAAGAQAPSTVSRPDIATSLGHPGWSSDLGNQVVWMVRHDEQTARITLNPPELGPLQITVNVSGDQATASFASPHADVRQAITDALPRLREMLAGAGIDLGQTNVGAQAQQERSGRKPESPANPRFANDKAILHSAGNAAGGASSPPLSQRGRGLVDLFA
ncbi:MAG TPA: flagellar hook-length control protein FliK [Rhodocyclaceae bacterium]|nr:flagellar hook-length control protein FliK [Rhodocyclaceae bacterium]HNL20833.1 flagellar hook-length control protein FliK [Rhodocyclaceae bacterium]HNM80611.1 flagellar hook-length control protein FliK [Rhodocyclaceae bacterium]HNP05388.1 flagellar hook-length control protein FliK [Rhodocyclaceae bacterium]